jgi:Rha family phage regulatory protein
MTKTVLNFQAFIDADGDVLTTDSRRVAVVHGKRHDNVLKLIRSRLEEAMEEHPEWASLNFEECSFEQGGRLWPMFTMTQEGYAFIMGKMTGKKAVSKQIAYIEAFRAMKAYIKNQREGLTYQCMEKERESIASEERGKFHGSGLSKRRWEKPRLDAELAALKALVQPSLLN